MRQVTRRPRPDGRAERDAAMRQVEEHAPASWKAEADRTVRTVAEALPEFTSDDVWAAGLSRPPEARALGPVMARAARAGWIEDSGRVTHGTDPDHHADPARVWKSLIYRLDAPDPRAVPGAQHTALPERALDEVVHKMRKGKAQSKAAAPVHTPRPKKTPEEQEELQRRAEEQLQRQIDARRRASGD